jgi:hypothetical protein
MTKPSLFPKSNIRHALIVLIMLLGFQTATAQFVIIGTGTSTTNGSDSDPIDGFYESLHYQTVYTAAELLAAGLAAGNNLSAIGFSVSQGYAGAPLENYTIKLGTTTQIDASAYISTPMTTVKNPFSYTPTVQTAGNFDMIGFDTFFPWDGTSNIVVDICTGDSNPFSSPYGGVRVTAMTGGASYVRSDPNPVCEQATGDDPSGYDGAILDNRPNVRFNYTATNCTPPAATYTILPDCANGQYSIQVNLTSMGTATSIVIKEGGTTFATATATGNYIAGPFTAGSSHTVTLEHNLDIGCSIGSGSQTFGCPPANDECANAAPLTSGTYPTAPFSSSTQYATTSSQTPSCSNSLIGDVWFSFVATAADQDVSVTAFAVNPATDVYLGIAVYSGSCGSLIEESCGDARLTGLTVGDTYYIQLWTDDYDGPNPSFTYDIMVSDTASGPPVNDDAVNAITLNVGAPCTGSPYYNTLATLGAGEPYSNCNSSSTGQHSVWFKFVAPPSGTAKITTDIAAGGSLFDTKIGLFSVTNPSDYSTFTILACDEENGVLNAGYLSTMFATGLTPGATYYVEVDGYSSSSVGSFCIQVIEINPTMLSNSATCAPLQVPVGSVSAYNGWVTLLDEAGKLVALVRNPAGGQVDDYNGAYNIDGNGFGTPRQDGTGAYYLSRNYNINNTGATNVDIQFFFHPGEIATLTGVSGGAATLANLGVTRQAGTTCNADFLESNGAVSVLNQTSNGVVNGVSWIQVTTPGFSNFYLMGGTTPLPINLENISAANVGKENRVDWKTAHEDRGDYFELERSADGKNFGYLATVKAAEKAQGYTYWDKAPVNGVNYYRLKMMDAGGKFSYSKVVTAALDRTPGFAVTAFPNPVTHTLKVKIHAGGADARVILSDVTGRPVRSYEVTGAELDIDMSGLASGVYVVKYQDGSHSQTLKVSKQ